MAAATAAAAGETRLAAAEFGEVGEVAKLK